MKLLIDARSIVDPTRGGVSRGVGRVALECVVAYAERFPEDTIICITTGRRRPQLPERLTAHRNVTHCHIFLPNKIWSALCILRLVSLAGQAEKRVGKIDAIFLPNLAFIGRMDSRDAERGPGRMTMRPYALLLHDLSFLIEPKWFTWRLRLWHHAVRAKKQIKDASHLFAVSQTTKNDAMRLLNIPAEKISVIPIGSSVGAGFPRPPAGQPQGIAPTNQKYILILGGNDPRKNSETAIAAMNTLRKEEKYKNFEYIIVGAHRCVRPSACRPGQTHRSAPTDTDLASLYANAAAFFYPSWYEGYGLPLHEAAQYGTPRVASTAGALPETAPAGTLFANPAKPQQWVEAIKLALEQPRIALQQNPNAWRDAASILRQRLG